MELVSVGVYSNCGCCWRPIIIVHKVGENSKGARVGFDCWNQSNALDVLSTVGPFDVLQWSDINQPLDSREIDASMAAAVFSEALTHLALHTWHWLMCAAIVLYDYALTLAREIELFWQRPKRSWGFVLFVANRYAIILGHVPIMVYAFWTPANQSVSHLSLIRGLSRILTWIHPFPTLVVGILVRLFVGWLHGISGANPYGLWTKCRSRSFISLEWVRSFLLFPFSSL